MDYTVHGIAESDTTEHFHFHLMQSQLTRKDPEAGKD